MSEILLGRPSNLHVPMGTRVDYVDSDTFNICNRLREISRDLYLVVLQGDEQHMFSVVESCPDGWEREVKRYPQLDARILREMQMFEALPLQSRVDFIDKQHKRLDAERKENELEDLYERVGAPMWGDLERCGFIQRPVSYPKSGAVGGRGSAAKA